MNAEERFARHLCCALDRELARLPADIVERLRAARCLALEAERAKARAPAIRIAKVGADGATLLGGGHPWRMFFAVGALLLGVAAAYYWNVFEQAEATQEIDLELLADDLPPKAYLDPGFQPWLSHYVIFSR